MLLHLRAAHKRGTPLLARDESQTVALKHALDKWGKRWTSRLDDMSAEIAAKFAKKTFRATQSSLMAAFRKAGFTVKFQPTQKSLDAYKAVIAENVNLIKSIPQQYLKDVESRVWESVRSGGDLSTLTKGLQKTYGISYRRAALIARDQNNKAKAVIENVRRQELGITEAIWQHSHAGKVPRPTHVAMNGKKFKLAEGMYDRDEGKWVLPGELINCRCTSRSIIPGL